MSAPPPRCLVVGLGAIGRRHVRNLLDLRCEVAALRSHPAAADETQREFGITAFSDSRDAARWAPEFTIVANVTTAHLSTATWAVAHGSHVLIEKPIAESLDGIDALLSAAERGGRCIAVGCNLRFHPALETIRDRLHSGRVGRLLTARCAVGQYLPDWHPASDYRLEYSARAEQGGGALRTLIHELDLMLWIAGPVQDAIGWRTRVSTLAIDVDDVAELICRHQSGALTSVHMDFVDRSYHRASRWVAEEGTLSWTWGEPVRQLGPGNRVEVLWHDAGFDVNDTYRRELMDFLDAARRGSPPRTDGCEARRTLEVALGAREI